MFYIYIEESIDYILSETIVNVWCAINDCHLTNDGKIKEDILDEIINYQVSNITFSNCKIKYIQKIPNIEYIECVNCTELEYISNIDSLFEMHLIKCPKLKELPKTLEFLEYLTLEDTAIKVIPKYNNLRELHIRNSVNIQSLSKLKKLNCTECKKMTIPNMPFLKQLICHDTTFESIGMLPKLTNVYGHNKDYIKNFNKIAALKLLLMNSNKKPVKNAASLIKDVNIWKYIFNFV